MLKLHRTMIFHKCSACTRNGFSFTIYPHRSALALIKPCFSELLVEQDFLETAEQWKKVLALLPKKVADDLDREWTEAPMSSQDKWRRLRTEVKVCQSREFIISELVLVTTCHKEFKYIVPMPYMYMYFPQVCRLYSYSASISVHQLSECCSVEYNYGGLLYIFEYSDHVCLPRIRS